MLWRIPVAAVLAAVLLMLWGFLFWMVMPFAEDVIREVKDEAAVDAVLKENLPESGVYVLYEQSAEENKGDGEQTDSEAKQQQAVLGQIFYQTPALSMDDQSLYLKGMLHYFVTALLAAIIVALAGRGRSFFGRLVVSLLVVVFALVWTLPANVIWFNGPADYCKMIMGFNFVGGALMSFVIALLVRHRPVED